VLEKKGKVYRGELIARASLVLITDRTDLSPIALRVVKAPAVDTLSPRERADGSG